MSSRLIVSLPVVALVALVAARPAIAKPIDADVRDAFTAYAEAVAAGNGKRALELTDRATLRYNDILVEHARTADRAVLAKLPIVDRLAILRLRQELTKAELAQMKGADVVRHGVERGWSKIWKLDTTAIEAIAVDGAQATVTVPGGQFGKTVDWQLRREGKAWRVSVVSVLPAAEALLQRTARRFDKSEDELVALALRMMTDKDLSPALWDGPR